MESVTRGPGDGDRREAPISAWAARLRAVLATIERILKLSAYLFLLLAIFTVAAYVCFSLFVRSGSTAVPDLVGANTEEARRMVEANGLRMRVKEDSARYDPQVPTGYVLQQAPIPNSLAKRGGSVDVILSLGPELVSVPDVRGTALQAAQVTLNAAGLILGHTPTVFGDQHAPGTVVEQGLAPGGNVARGTAVDLYLCLESAHGTFVMPDLAYRDYEEVRRFFERQGFRLGSIKPEAYEGIAPGIVLRQFPLPGHPLRRQDVISLVIAAEVSTVT